MFDEYGRVTGYGQMAPGRDLSPYEDPKKNGRPANPQQHVLNAAIAGQAPQGTFAGASTIGANTNRTPETPAIDRLSQATGGIQATPTQRFDAPPTQAPAAIPPPADPASGGIPETFNPVLGQHAGRLQGFNLDNLQAGAGRNTPKELMGRVFSNYSPEDYGRDENVRNSVIADLNKLGIGDFYADRTDKIGVRNARNNQGWGAGNLGHDGLWDVIGAQDLERGTSAGWTFQDLMGNRDDPNYGQQGMALPFLQTAIAGESPAPGGDYSANLLKQIMAALQNDPQMAQLARVYGN